MTPSTSQQASGSSWLALLGQVIEGLFVPAPLSAPRTHGPRAWSAQHAGAQALEIPTYLRRGIRIPELE